MSTRKYNLEARLIEFAVSILNLVEQLPNSPIGRHLGNQLLRSGTAPALNYGEAQSAESRKDFIHKMKIALKELRETSVCLKILQKKGILSITQINLVLQENNELISIFVKSIQTSQNNMVSAKSK